MKIISLGLWEIKLKLAIIICFLLTAASVFSEQRHLEPMPTERKVRWRKEIDWILSVADHIVDFIPSQQKTDDGSNMEVRLVMLF